MSAARKQKYATFHTALAGICTHMWSCAKFNVHSAAEQEGSYLSGKHGLDAQTVALQQDHVKESLPRLQHHHISRKQPVR